MWGVSMGKEQKKKTLKRLREEKGDSQKVVAEYLGYSQGGYNLLENGKRGVKAKDLQKLAEYYGISSDQILLSEGQ